MRRLASVLALLPAAAMAQATTVDYPDSTLNTPQGQYPIYTGTATNVIRGQLFCPASFPGLPTTPAFVGKIGVQLSNTAVYSQFIVRVGTTSVPALTPTWNTNLPDQRIQVDLSGQTLSGQPGANIWVEWDLAHPFLYTPGDSIVLDITSQAQSAGQYCSTAIGTGVARMISTNYTGQTTGAPATSGGIKFRMVFYPVGSVVPYGTGCHGSGNFTPQISSMGSSQVGSPNFMIHLSTAFGGAPATLLVGAERLNLPFGGGCSMLVQPILQLGMPTGGSGAGQGTAMFPLPIPNNPFLIGLTLPCQWVQLDPGSPGLLPFAVSQGASVVIY